MKNHSPVPAGIQPEPSVRAVVTEIRELQRVNGRPVFQIALDRSIFPLATGSPVGTLTATARSGAVLVAPVTAVQQDASGQRWHTTEKPLQPGTEVLLYVCQ